MGNSNLGRLGYSLQINVEARNLFFQVEDPDRDAKLGWYVQTRAYWCTKMFTYEYRLKGQICLFVFYVVPFQ